MEKWVLRKDPLKTHPDFSILSYFYVVESRVNHHILFDCFSYGDKKCFEQFSDQNFGVGYGSCQKSKLD